jgi:hypothetical protein
MVEAEIRALLRKRSAFHSPDVCLHLLCAALHYNLFFACILYICSYKFFIMGEHLNAAYARSVD